ncbi:uncharacterized protein LOC109595585 isoform X1 [Aethina tumida]|uniref:uncharacterized protein LOC109595585 isoform X1 n=1 Tax=Aethina tumida TaxID=116153 RepID=UPI002147231D|nr:uncharacterized protein LOC109595585 isoform X1 [Aethina tumida]
MEEEESTFQDWFGDIMDGSMPVIVFLVMLGCVFILYTYIQCKIKGKENSSFYRYHTVPACNADFLLWISQRQQNEVFSISGRVQGQNPTQTLSSDAFVSIGHITASNQFNKPPTNDEPPSYEEAICLPVPDLRQTRIQVQQPPSHTVAMN